MADPTAASYDALAPEYARRLSGELDAKPFDRDFLRRCQEWAPPGRVLDAGCGPGHIGRFLQNGGREIVGVDVSVGMARVARRLSQSTAYCLGDLRAIPFAGSTFSVVLAFYSIIHLDRSELPFAFAEIFRVLAPGGLLAVAFHVGDEVRHVDTLWGVDTRLDFRFFDPAEVTGLISRAGLEVVERTVRPPYDETVEAQTFRCYILARAPAARVR